MTASRSSEAPGAEPRRLDPTAIQRLLGELANSPEQPFDEGLLQLVIGLTNARGGAVLMPANAAGAVSARLATPAAGAPVAIAAERVGPDADPEAASEADGAGEAASAAYAAPREGVLDRTGEVEAAQTAAISRAAVRALVLQPEAGAHQPRLLAAWSKLAGDAASARRARFARMSEPNWTLIATPAAQGPSLAVALDLRGQPIEPYLPVLQLAAELLTVHELKTFAGEQHALAQRAAALADIASRVSQQRSPDDAAVELAACLAEATGAARVVVGSADGGRVIAASGLAQPEVGRTEHVRQIREALQEAAREERVCVPPIEVTPEGMPIDVAHRELARALGAPFVMGLALRDGATAVATVLLTWSALPTRGAVAVVDATTRLAPLLRLQREARGGWLRAAWRRLAAAPLKVAAAALLGVALALAAVWPVEHRVHAQASLEPEARRVIAAPYDAILLQAAARVGDRVEAGQLLAVLDGRELRYQLAGLEAQLARSDKERDVAMADEAVAKAQAAALESARLRLEIATVRDRLANLEIRSPIAGVIIQGDLERARGAPLQTGQVLFEVAPLASLRLAIEVPVEDVAFVQAGQRASLRLASRPGQPRQLMLERLQPRATVQQGAAVFLAFAPIDNPDLTLLPGMEGHVRISIAEQPLGWVLFHKLAEWVRVQLWI